MVSVLVPVSGGKDSQACLELSLQLYPASEVRGLFCDTRFEHPKTYQHVEWMRQHYGVQIDAVCGGDVLSKSIKYRRFPGGGARHCTDELKIKETKIYCKQLAEQQGGFQVWYGMRSGESKERLKRYANKIDLELYQPHEVIPKKYPKYLGKMGVLFRLPVLDWTTEEVFRLLNGRENPLYAEGFERVGCFPCLAAGDAHKAKCFNHDAFGQAQYISVIKVSKQIGKSVWTSKKQIQAHNENQGCLLCSI